VSQHLKTIRSASQERVEEKNKGGDRRGWDGSLLSGWIGGGTQVGWRGGKDGTDFLTNALYSTPGKKKGLVREEKGGFCFFCLQRNGGKVASG